MSTSAVAMRKLDKNHLLAVCFLRFTNKSAVEDSLDISEADFLFFSKCCIFEWIWRMIAYVGAARLGRDRFHCKLFVAIVQ